MGDDGNVKAVRVVSSLPDGLTEQAVAAARLSTFKPATKDGKPVQFWIGMAPRPSISAKTPASTPI